MRLIFAGTPAFAGAALAALIEAGHELALVLTQPDRPAGRGMKLVPGAVKQMALQHGLAVAQPATLRDAAVQQRLRELQAEAMVVAAYGLILPQAVLEAPRAGCINIHASLLPRWRGAAPIQRALLAGDGETGISIMRMDAGLDTGPVLLRQALPIAATDTAATLHDKLAALGAGLIVDALARLAELEAEAQAQAGATYAAKIEKGEAAIDWRRPAAALERQVRAFDPFPGALAQFGAENWKIWRAQPLPDHGDPGCVLAADSGGIVVACGEGALRLLELQKPGGRRLPVADFLRGVRIAAGERFALPA